MDRDWNGCKRIGGSPGLGEEASWGPQFASEMDESLLLSSGKLRKELMDASALDVKDMPFSRVDMRYRMTYLAAAICAGDAQ